MKVNFDVSAIKEIDYKNKVIRFDPSKISKIKKIGGSNFSTAIGKSKYDTPFAAACNRAGIYSEHTESESTNAGEILEPVIRSYLSKNLRELIGGYFDLKDDDVISIEEPVDKMYCGYDHFKEVEKFGGMVDGYVRINRKRAAILEIKTSKNENDWFDGSGKSKVPVNYILQASLYAKLSQLEKIVFVAGFLMSDHLKDPHSWTPCKDNCEVIVTDKASDIDENMAAASQWYDTHLKGGVTPQWDENNENDLRIVDALTEALNKPSKELEELIGEYIEIENKISEYAEISNKISELEKAKKPLKEEIRTRMISMLSEGEEKREIKQGGHSFTISAKESKSINEDRLKEDDLYDKYLDISVTHTLRFK